jgi:hypothetical protein
VAHGEPVDQSVGFYGVEGSKPGPPDSQPPPPPLIVTGSQFNLKVYKEEYLTRLRTQLGVEGDPDEPIEYLISTTMDPWMTDTSKGNFIPTLIDALRQTVITVIDEIRIETDAGVTDTGT